MGTRITKEMFKRVTSEESSKLFTRLGFNESEHGTLMRESGDIVHAFGFTPNPSFTRFHVPVGAYVPSLEARFDYLNGVHCPGLLVSRWLGEFKPRYGQSDVYYHFATVEAMRKKLAQVYTDFVDQAEPWLARLTTIEEVSKEFFKWRIAPPAAGHNRPPDPFAWAIYGWLLREAGHDEDARRWLVQAHDFLQQPEAMKADRLIPRAIPALQPTLRRAEEDRLMELLKRDLA